MNNNQVSSTTAEHPLSAVVTTFHQTTRGTLGDRAYLALRRAILSGDLPPRTRLREVELATLIPISRTPVREALRRLRDEGLLVNGEQRALEVRDLDLGETFNTYQILEVLEPLAASLAARRITNDDIATLRESVDLTEFFCERERWDEVTRESQRFHELIYEASGNERLARLIRPLREEAHRFRRFRVREPVLARRAIEEDRKIIDALELHDADEAHRVMYEHIHLSTELIGELISEGASLNPES